MTSASRSVICCIELPVHATEFTTLAGMDEPANGLGGWGLGFNRLSTLHRLDRVAFFTVGFETFDRYLFFRGSGRRGGEFAAPSIRHQRLRLTSSFSSSTVLRDIATVQATRSAKPGRWYDAKRDLSWLLRRTLQAIARAQAQIDRGHGLSTNPYLDALRKYREQLLAAGIARGRALRAILLRRQHSAADPPGRIVAAHPNLTRGPNCRRSIRCHRSPAGLLRA